MEELIVIEETIKKMQSMGWGCARRRNLKLKKIMIKNISEYSDKLKKYILHNRHDDDKSPENLSFKLMGLEFSNEQLNEMVSVIDKLNLWNTVCKYQKNLSGKFIIDHIDKLNIENLLKYQNPSEKVLGDLINLKKIKKKRIWNILWNNCALSDKFMQCHIKHIDWKIITKKQILSDEFIVKNKESFAGYIRDLFKYQKVPENMIDYFINLQNNRGRRFPGRRRYMSISIHENQILCELIMRYQNPPRNIIKHYGINKYIVSSTIKYNKLDENTIEDILDRWVYHNRFEVGGNPLDEYEDDNEPTKKIMTSCICRYQYLSEKFIEKHEKILDWKLISQYQKLTFDLLLRYPDRINWCGVFKNKYMNNLPHLEDIKSKYFRDLKRVLDCYEKMDMPGELVQIIRMYQYK